MLMDDLRQLPAFTNMTDELLRSVCDAAREVNLAEGEILFYEGDSAKGLYILLEGELLVTKGVGGQDVVLGRPQAGSFVGEISLLTGSPHTATAYASKPSRFLKLDVDDFRATLDTSPIARLILPVMAERLRSNEALLQQHEKLSALGKMAAGLAHELNNPASASLRAAKQLREAVNILQSLTLELPLLNVTADQIEFLRSFQEHLRAASPPALDPLTRSDREDQLTAWLDTQGIPDGWRLAPAFVSAGLDGAQLEHLKSLGGLQSFAAILTWLEGHITITTLLNAIEHSSGRIVDLVHAVKTYSYMDQAPIQDVDVHEGLESTLTMLGHRLKNIVITREYDRGLPHITAYGSELNQVWTNIIDNAIDAMEGRGQLRLRTWREHDGRVAVEIEDSGSGIPPDIQHRIFEPFFTTKSVGKGTGLGLDIAYRIVVSRHHGDIRVFSQPGSTQFRVWLPVHLE